MSKRPSPFPPPKQRTVSYAELEFDSATVTGHLGKMISEGVEQVDKPEPLPGNAADVIIMARPADDPNAAPIPVHITSVVLRYKVAES